MQKFRNLIFTFILLLPGTAAGMFKGCFPKLSGKIFPSPYLGELVFQGQDSEQAILIEVIPFLSERDRHTLFLALNQRVPQFPGTVFKFDKDTEGMLLLVQYAGYGEKILDMLCKKRPGEMTVFMSGYEEKLMRAFYYAKLSGHQKAAKRLKKRFDTLKSPPTSANKVRQCFFVTRYETCRNIKRFKKCLGEEEHMDGILNKYTLEDIFLYDWQQRGIIKDAVLSGSCEIVELGLKAVGLLSKNADATEFCDEKFSSEIKKILKNMKSKDKQKIEKLLKKHNVIRDAT